MGQIGCCVKICPACCCNTSKEDDFDGDGLRDRPLHLDSAENAAKLLGVEDRLDMKQQTELFDQNAWTPFVGHVVQSQDFKVHEEVDAVMDFNKTMQKMATGDTKPRCWWGKYEYREDIVGFNFKYPVMCYLDQNTRIICLDGKPTMCAIQTMPQCSLPADHVGAAKVGDTFTYRCNGVGENSEHKSPFGMFDVDVEVVDEEFQYKNK
eukprot:CAMPEP_0197037540 /NCGR_PEP_ID=MMETSP1384-20130603/14726_1 /TAXON_ID=29189 /ORGANISM="Ammonia sp." /LENGTH=207 /DNA_ID=CAMNT_0042467853 /DNA_START=9 /DNA_END=632 /DNA_ORIENTATION=+